MFKRVFDILLSAAGIIIMLPLAILMALLIYIDDKGPIFFRQERIGLNLKPFTLYKFRTMKSVSRLVSESFDPGNQSRVTKFGRLLRKTKLDELPQLINVLKNDMSLVGPRPEVRKWVEAFPQQWAAILKVKPGITDYAAIIFRNEEELLSESDHPERDYKEIILPHKLDIYMEYMMNRSFGGDIMILLKTIVSIFKFNKNEHSFFKNFDCRK